MLGDERRTIRELYDALRGVIALVDATEPAPGLTAIRDHARRALQAAQYVKKVATDVERRRLRLVEKGGQAS